jgi:S-adenosyl methyltransferase
MVAAHARDLPVEGDTSRFLQADVRDPAGLLDDPQTSELIDFSQPVGLLMTAVIHFIPDGGDPWGLVGRYLAAVAPGSYLVLSHSTKDQLPPRMVAAGLELVPAQPGGDPSVGFVGAWGA